MGNPSQSYGAVKFHIIMGHLCLFCRPHNGSALLGKLVCSFNLAYVAGWVDQCMGFRDWSSRLFRVPLQRKSWKTL